MLDAVLSLYTRAVFFLNGVIDHGVVLPEGTTTAPPAGAPVGGGYAPPPPEAGGFPWMIVIIYVGLFAGIYFLFFRPQRKREKAMKEMQAAIGLGDNVVTSGGLFGKVADVGEDCFIVEFGTNRGVRIPIAKGDVVAVREPKMTPQPKVDP